LGLAEKSQNRQETVLRFRIAHGVQANCLPSALRRIARELPSEIKIVLAGTAEPGSVHGQRPWFQNVMKISGVEVMLFR
jgi:hypothetical protein